jgi:hypothetical protein
VVAAIFVASAFAYSITPPLGLSHGTVYSADTSWAQPTSSVNGNADHTFCPAITQGARAYDQSYTYISYASPCGPGYQYTAFCGCVTSRGAAYNPNAMTFDNFSSLNWYW